MSFYLTHYLYGVLYHHPYATNPLHALHCALPHHQLRDATKHTLECDGWGMPLGLLHYPILVYLSQDRSLDNSHDANRDYSH